MIGRLVTQCMVFQAIHSTGRTDLKDCDGHVESQRLVRARVDQPNVVAVESLARRFILAHQDESQHVSVNKTAPLGRPIRDRASSEICVNLYATGLQIRTVGAQLLHTMVKLVAMVSCCHLVRVGQRVSVQSFALPRA